jgi:hypothetical protein
MRSARTSASAPCVATVFCACSIRFSVSRRWLYLNTVVIAIVARFERASYAFLMSS